MTFTLPDISVFYPMGDAPDEYYIRRDVDSHMYECVALCNTYDWLFTIRDIPRRGYTAVYLYQHFIDIVREREWRLTMDDINQVLQNLKRIITEAWDTVRSWKIITIKPEPAPQHAPAAVPAEYAGLVDAVADEVLRRMGQEGCRQQTPYPLCSYINTRHELRSSAEIHLLIREKAALPAPAFAAWLKEAQRLHYIHTGADNAKQIYDTLNQHYHLSYGYANFAKYFTA